MAKASRPGFIGSKGDANLTADAITTENILQHYRDIARGAYEWDGLPEDVPEGYIEAALFDRPGVGFKVTKAFGPVILPCNAPTVDMYGQPVKWLPAPVGMTEPGTGELYDLSDGPVLWQGMSMAMRVEPYAQIMSKALKTLGQNVTALSQPVLLSGTPSGSSGDNIGAILLKSDISAGSCYIPVVEPGALKLEVLDLKAQDHTQNLFSVIQACDAAILEIMGASNGVEKSSGVSALETVSGVMPVTMSHDWGLKLRQRWAEKVNAEFGTSITVTDGIAWIEGTMPEPENDGNDNEGGDEDGDMEKDS